MGDVARLSGVSRATVDRVINKRAGVRSDTVRKVEQVLQQLGYATSALSAIAPTLSGQVAILLCEGENPFFGLIREKLETTLQSPAFAGVDCKIQTFDPYNPKTLVAALGAIATRPQAVITIGCDIPEVERAIDKLTEAGIRVVTMISDVPRSRRITHVGQDSISAGRTAGRLVGGFIPPGPGKVAVLLGHYQFRHLLDRMTGFRQTMGLVRPEIEILQPPPYGRDPDRARGAIAEIMQAGDDLKGVYITGGGQPALLSALEGRPRDLHVVGHELSTESRTALLDGRISALLCQDISWIWQRALTAALGPEQAPALESCPIEIFLPENLPSGV